MYRRILSRTLGAAMVLALFYPLFMLFGQPVFGFGNFRGALNKLHSGG